MIRDELNPTKSMLRPIHQFRKSAADILHSTGAFATVISLNPDQERILNWRIDSGVVAGVIGPAGCGKTTIGSFLRSKWYVKGMRERSYL
jgi:hypothetical protein